MLREEQGASWYTDYCLCVRGLNPCLVLISFGECDCEPHGIRQCLGFDHSKNIICVRAALASQTIDSDLNWPPISAFSWSEFYRHWVNSCPQIPTAICFLMLNIPRLEMRLKYKDHKYHVALTSHTDVLDPFEKEGDHWAMKAWVGKKMGKVWG